MVDNTHQNGTSEQADPTPRTLSEGDERIGMSLVVTCYKLEHYIRKTLASVFAQDYPGPMQLVVVDDCSPDDSWNEIRKAVDELGQGWNVTLIRNEVNLGVAGATNVGWRAAIHDWIVAVDGDDAQAPDRCSKMAEAIRSHPDVGMMIFSARRMGADDEVLDGYDSYSLFPYDDVPDELWLNTPELRYENLYGTRHPERRLGGFGATSCFRRSLFLKWGELTGLQKNQPISQDTIWSWRYMASAPVYASKQIACYYRTHGGNLYNATHHTGYQGYVETERHYCRRRKMQFFSHRALLADVDRALAEPALSQWSPDVLRQVRDHIERDLPNDEMCCDWWDIPWRCRLWRTFHYRNRVTPTMRKWAMLRLLPLAMTAWLRWLLKEKLRKH